MKSNRLIVFVAAGILMAACGKNSPSSSATPPQAPADAASTSPAAQAALTAWQQGDKAAAVSNFLATDWSAHPLFAAGSTLGLNEAAFGSLTDAERQGRSSDLTSQLSTFKQLAQAVAQAGRDAASKGDASQARKYFTSLKQCGVAFESPDCLQLVRLVGKAIEKNADSELAKMSQ